MTEGYGGAGVGGGWLAGWQSQEVCLVHGSFLEVDWSDASLVLANSTCFEDDLMAAIAHKAQSLQPGR